MSISSDRIHDEVEDILAPISGMDVLLRITDEISKVAAEIEDLPVGDGSMSSEQIMALQKIDFCRQRLMEVTKVMHNAFSHHGDSTAHHLEDLLRDVALEHTHTVFRRG